MISGHISGLKSDSVYLYNTLTNKKEPSFVKDGNFSFTGKLDFPEMYQVYFDAEEDKFINLFLENSAISINGHIDSLDKILIAGSASNDEYLNYRKDTKTLRDEFKAADNLLSEAQDKMEYEKADSIQLVVDNAAHKILNKVFEYATANKGSAILPYITFMACMNAPDKVLADKIIDLHGPENKTNPRIAALNKMFADIVKTAVGSPASDFEMNTSEGKIISLHALKGKVVLLDFWASWCLPCIKGFPELKDIYKKYRGNKFEIIGFSIDKDKDAWQRVLNNKKLPWPQVVELKGPDGPTPGDYGIMFVPTSYLIDRKGKIAGMNLHGKKLTDKVEELLKEKN